MQYLTVLTKISRDSEILESQKPTKVINDVEGHFVCKKGDINLVCTRFKTRIMSDRNQVRKLMR
jgi:hypothetical protein